LQPNCNAITYHLSGGYCGQGTCPFALRNL
jgi:hypothetical protein